MEDEGRDRAIDEYLEMYPMPPEYSAWRAVILCNDCVKESDVPHHFAFHRCPRRRCRSYNTDVVRVLKIQPGSEEDIRRRAEAGLPPPEAGAAAVGEAKLDDEASEYTVEDDDEEDEEDDEDEEGGAEEFSADDFELLQEGEDAPQEESDGDQEAEERPPHSEP